MTEVQLGVAGGRVRCGACLSVFTGIDNLVAGSGHRLRPGESADSALDALLDELRNETPAPRVAPKPEKTTGIPGAVAPAAPTTAAAPKPKAEPEPVPEPVVKVLPLPEVEAVAENEIDDESEIDDEAEFVTDVSDRDAEKDIVVAEATSEPAPLPEAVQHKPAPIPEPPPKPAVQRDGVGRTGVRSRAPVAPINPVNPMPPVRPVRAALDLAVDPDELLVVPPPRRRWVWPLLVLCIAGLGGEALYLQFDEWSKNPQIRPVYEWLCPRLGCQLPDMRAVDKMLSKNLVVRANPEVAGKLLVDAIIVNEAKFAQPFPDVELRFSALDGNLVTAQRYRPDQYLAGELKGIKMIAPLTPVHIALDIDDPGQRAVNYVMVFR